MISYEYLTQREQLGQFVKNNPLFWSTFAKSYHGHPWNEYLFCPKCKLSDDYGPIHTYGIEQVSEQKLSTCPDCGTRLVEYWSLVRIENYFRVQTNNYSKAFLMLVVKVNSEPAGFYFGFEYARTYIEDVAISSNKLSDKCFYIDLIYLDRKFRRNPGIADLFRVILIFLKQRYCPFRKSIYDKILNHIGSPMVFSSYQALLEQLVGLGYQEVLTRTHIKAKNVHRILNVTGYKRLDYSSKIDSDRIFYIFRFKNS